MSSAPAIRIVVLGTGDFALPIFDALCNSGHQVLALVTQPDRPQGRKQELTPSRLKVAAEDRAIPVLQPENVNAPAAIESVRSLEPDILVTAAYGQILSPELLAVPRLRAINLHGSILPAYRGAAPVARAIQDGEAETGVTVIRMTPRIDAGGMIAFARTAIGPDETAGELEDRLAALGAPLVLEVIGRIVEGTAQIIPQDRSKVTKAPKLSKEDGRIDWTLPAQAVHNLVRAMQPWPQGSTTWTPSGDAVRRQVRLIVQRTQVVDRPEGSAPAAPGTVLEAGGSRLIVAAGSGAVQLLTVQVPGKKPMPAADFLRGHRVQEGDLMGD
jgi:methionyl-tRNA formyltransferase